MRLDLPARYAISFIASILCANICCAQYRVVPGETDEDGCSMKTAARVCLGASAKHCYAAPSDRNYIFSMEPAARTIGQIGGQPLILFSALFTGCGSGTLTSYSLLTVRNGDFVSLLPKLELTNVSEHRIWNLPQISNLPILASADFIWDLDKETHFESHRYRIKAFVFEPKSGRYIERVNFDTSRKYSGPPMSFSVPRGTCARARNPVDNNRSHKCHRRTVGKYGTQQQGGSHEAGGATKPVYETGSERHPL